MKRSNFVRKFPKRTRAAVNFFLDQQGWKMFKAEVVAISLNGGCFAAISSRDDQLGFMDTVDLPGFFTALDLDPIDEMCPNGLDREHINRYVFLADPKHEDLIARHVCEQFSHHLAKEYED